MATTKYPTKPLDCWNKAKEIRQNYYKSYAEAHDKGALRWAGGAWSFDAIPRGLGEDVRSITSEPYGASIAFDREFSTRCLEAVEKAGYARDLVSVSAHLACSIRPITPGRGTPHMTPRAPANRQQDL